MLTKKFWRKEYERFRADHSEEEAKALLRRRLKAFREAAAIAEASDPAEIHRREKLIRAAQKGALVLW